MALTIDNLEIQIDANAKRATSGVDALAESLGRLKTAVGNTSGLAANLTQISTALKSFSGLGKINLTSPIKQLEKLNSLIPTLGSGQATQLAQNLRDIAMGLSAFSTVPKVSLVPAANGITSISNAMNSLDTAKLGVFSNQMKSIAEGLSQLSGVGKTNIGSTVNALKKIPEIIETLKPEIVEQFADKIRQLTAVVTPLAEQMDKIARGFNALPRSIKKAVSATNQVVDSNKKLKVSLNSVTTALQNTLSKYMSLYYNLSRIAGIFAEWFKESNDYIESLNLFKISMGDASDAAKKYAEKVGKALGIDPAEWMQNQGVFKNLAAGFGIASDSANTMSQNLTQLTYDMASFYNADVKTAFDKLSSAMSGQVKGLREFGIDTTIASLEQYALSKGIDTSVRSMSQAQKAMLRYSYIMEKSADLGILNDMKRTILSPANAMRVLSAQITLLKRSLGNIVSVLVTKFIPYIMAAVQLVEEFASALAKAWEFEIPEFPEAEFDIGGAIEEEVDQAEDALKDLKKQLMGFDELNILKSPDSDSNNSSKELDDILNGLIDENQYNFLDGFEGLNLEPYKQKIREICDVFKDIFGYVVAIKGGIKAWDLASAVGKAANLSNHFKLAAGSAMAIGGGILEAKGAIDAVKNGLGGQSFTEMLLGGGSLTGGAAMIGAQFGKALIGGGIGAIVAGIPMFITGIYDAIVEGLNWLNATLIPLGSTLTGAGIGALIGSLGGPIGTGVGALIGLVVGLLTDFGIWFWQKFDEIEAWFEGLPGWGKFIVKLVQNANPLISLITNIITAIKKWEKIAPWFNENVLQPVRRLLAGFGASVRQTFEDAFYNIKVIATGCLEIIKLAWDKAPEWFDAKFVQPAKIIFTKLWDALPEGAKTAWANIKSAFSGVESFFKNKWSNVVSVFAPHGEFYVEIKDALSETIKGWINGLIEGLNNLFKKAFSGLNETIGKLRNFTVLDIQPFANLRDINVPQIPLFASGGFPNMGQMFIARERGPELVGRIGNKSAVANNDQITTGIASAVYSAMMAAQEDSSGGNGSTARIVVQIGDRAVGEAAVRFINGQIVQTGASPIYS